MPDIAVFHNRYKNYGGGERVADAIADVLDADLYTLWVSDSCADKTDATPLMQDRYSGLIGQFRRSLKAESMLRPSDIEAVDLGEYDTVITSGDLAHCYLPGDDQRHIHYSHTPNRDYFVGEEYRALTSGRGRIFKQLLMQYQRAVDVSHAPHVNHWLCNSELIAERGQRFYGVSQADQTVCPPPIAWDAYGPTQPTDAREDCFVTVGRLASDKNTALIVDAFTGRDEQLIVCGDGEQRDTLESMAPENVEIRGYVPEQKKIELIRNAQGFVFAGEREPFGMAIAEALSAGTPVIGVTSGNVPNLITDGGNGILTDLSVAGLRNGIDRLQSVDWSHDTIRSNAYKYSEPAFAERLKQVVSDSESTESMESIEA